MFCSAGQCVCVGVCVYAHARVWKGDLKTPRGLPLSTCLPLKIN